jgi:hypothetical protein
MTPDHPLLRRCSAAALVVLSVVVSAPALARTPAPVAAAPRLWDEGNALSSQARGDLERRLGSAEKRSGVPLYVLVTSGHRGEAMAELAAATFAARGLGADPARNAVLLVVAVHGGGAAVETGKGSAGIVPELDARRIVKQLMRSLSSRHPETAIGQAITALAASAQATAARRKPLPPDPLDGPLDDAPAPAEDGAAGRPDGGPLAPAAPPPEDELAAPRPLGDGGVDGGLVPGGPAGAATGSGRGSRLPIAIAIAALVVVALGLRRRKQLASNRPPEKEDRPRRF